MARIALFVIGALLVAGAARGQEFRSFNPIPTAGRLPAGAKLVDAKPVDPEAIKRAAEGFAANWNRGSTGEALAEGFYDATRFQDAMVANVPRDARLVLESVRGIQTLQQMEKDDGARGRVRISIVSATLATRIQFNDATQGFVDIPGVNEVILEVTERIR